MWDTGQVRENNDSEGQFQYNSMRHSTELLTSKNNADYFFLIYSYKASKNGLKDKKPMKNYIFKKIYTSLVRGSVVFQQSSLPPFSKLSKTKTPLQTTCSQEPRAPQLPARGLLSLKELNISVSYLVPNHLLLNDCSCWEDLHFSNQFPLMESRLYCGGSELRLPGL